MSGSFTLALGEDVCGRVLLPIRAPGWDRAEHLRVQLRHSADAQGQRLVYKRSSHVIHSQFGGWFTIKQQNFVPCFQTWWKTRDVTLNSDELLRKYSKAAAVASQGLHFVERAAAERQWAQNNKQHTGRKKDYPPESSCDQTIKRTPTL